MSGEKKKKLTIRNVEIAPISTLKPHPRNYRKHPPDQLAHIEASLRSHGFYRAIVTAKDRTILAGHGVYEASLRIGQTDVPILRLPIAADDPRALRILSGDNEIGKAAASDDRILTEILRDIANDSEGLVGTGFDEMQLAALAFTTRRELRDFDAAAEWVGMPEFNPGIAKFALVVSFRSEEDRKKFLRKYRLEVTCKKGKTWSTWWPVREIEDLSSLRWKEDGGKD